MNLYFECCESSNRKNRHVFSNRKNMCMFDKGFIPAKTHDMKLVRHTKRPSALTLKAVIILIRFYPITPLKHNPKQPIKINIFINIAMADLSIGWKYNGNLIWHTYSKGSFPQREFVCATKAFSALTWHNKLPSSVPFAKTNFPRTRGKLKFITW